MSDKIIAYKAMDKNMQCRGKQYEVGKTYHEDKADCCKAGMHACENPLDVLHYYPLKDSPRFFEVECGGDVDKSDQDSKLACTELTVKGELNLAGLIKATVGAIFKRAEKEKTATSGDSSSAATSGAYSSAATSGDSSSAATSGWRSSAATSGAYSSAAVLGKDSIAVANGAHSKARGALGCYLVLTEYDDGGNFLWAKMAHVDGKIIKENTWYTLKNGEFVEAES